MRSSTSSTSKRKREWLGFIKLNRVIVGLVIERQRALSQIEIDRKCTHTDRDRTGDDQVVGLSRFLEFLIGEIGPDQNVVSTGQDAGHRYCYGTRVGFLFGEAACVGHSRQTEIIDVPSVVL